MKFDPDISKATSEGVTATRHPLVENISHPQLNTENISVSQADQFSMAVALPGSIESEGQEKQNEEERNYKRIMELRRNPPIFLTLQEAADFLVVSRDTVRRWARAGRIRQFNRGTRNPLFASAELISSIKQAR
jgi:excisionase family DNA binding protein